LSVVIVAIAVHAHVLPRQAFWPPHWCPLLPPSRPDVPSQGLNIVTVLDPVVIFMLSIH